MHEGVHESGGGDCHGPCIVATGDQARCFLVVLNSWERDSIKGVVRAEQPSYLRMGVLIAHHTGRELSPLP